jgi:predicted HTH domain antitoxin
MITSSMGEDRMEVLQLKIPDELLAAKSKAQLEALAQEALLVKLFQQGEVSSGYAAEALGISRRAFLDLLGQYGVSMFADDTDVAAEADHS